MQKTNTYKQTNAEYAKIYGCSQSTITRYKSKGYPLDDPNAMMDVLSQQRTSPMSGGGDTKELRVARLKKLQLECKGLKHRLEAEISLYTANSDLQPKLQTLLAETSAVLRKHLVDELPPKCEGLNAADIQVKMRDALDAALTELSTPR